MTNKAVRATIQLGEIELDVYQLPDGEHRMTITQACEACNLDPRRFPQLLERKDVKAILGEALVTPNFQIKMKVETLDGLRQASLIALKHVAVIWRKAGTENGELLTDALLIEGLERRADAAFGIQRSEDERNQRLAARVQGKVARRTLTDSIADYLIANPDLPDNYRKFIWSNCSDHLNQIILGAKAKQAKEFLEVPKNSLLRNHIPIAALNELERVEDLASRIIDEKGTEPLSAVKQAAILMMTKTIGLI